jgi:phosphoribosylanthranilate isomerase
MARTRVKICGITTPDDALAAAGAGADAIGLVFYAQSPRCVSVPAASDIVAAVPPFVTVVALFVDEPRDSIERTLSDVRIDLLQFHGDETPSECDVYQRPWLKALRMRPELDLPAACRDYRGARAALLDTWQDGVPGGTGKTFDWALARRELALPVVLAGGLNAGNVGAAVRLVRPAAVDVSGGVEAAPGVKDHDKIRQFIAAVRDADRLLEE